MAQLRCMLPPQGQRYRKRKLAPPAWRWRRSGATSASRRRAAARRAKKSAAQRGNPGYGAPDPARNALQLSPERAAPALRSGGASALSSSLRQRRAQMASERWIDATRATESADSNLCLSLVLRHSYKYLLHANVQGITTTTTSAAARSSYRRYVNSATMTAHLHDGGLAFPTPALCIRACVTIVIVATIACNVCDSCIYEATQVASDQ